MMRSNNLKKGIKDLKFAKGAKKTAKSNINVNKKELSLFAKPRLTSKPQNNKNRRLTRGRAHLTWAMSEDGY
ncbi:hypothetical protein Hanom_Chr16g01441621 [Helianthus anomalus]